MLHHFQASFLSSCVCVLNPGASAVDLLRHQRHRAQHLANVPHARACAGRRRPPHRPQHRRRCALYCAGLTRHWMVIRVNCLRPALRMCWISGRAGSAQEQGLLRAERPVPAVQSRPRCTGAVQPRFVSPSTLLPCAGNVAGGAGDGDAGRPTRSAV